SSGCACATRCSVAARCRYVTDRNQRGVPPCFSRCDRSDRTATIAAAETVNVAAHVYRYSVCGELACRWVSRRREPVSWYVRRRFGYSLRRGCENVQYAFPELHRRPRQALG